MAFMASVVVNGHGKAVVTETGMNTQVGKIANMMIEDESPETPIQRKLAQVGKILGIVCLVICFIIFAIGLIKNINPVEMFMTSVGLAVAAIPEGLPAIVTIMLSIGVTKMAKENSIIRKLPAVETLGSSSVICSDKTGTLTQNKMKVVEISSKDENFTTELACMCTDCSIFYENGRMQVNGEPTEVALVNRALNQGKNKNELYIEMPRINEIPFDSNRKMMTTIHRIGNKYRVITKGAPDVLLEKCQRQINEKLETKQSQTIIDTISERTNIMQNQSNKNLVNRNEFKTRKSTLIEKIKIQKENERMAKKALRVIAIAYKDLDFLPQKIDTHTIENNLTFVGLIGMMDPPRDRKSVV